MLISRHNSTKSSLTHPALESISSERLRNTVIALNYPRHYLENPDGNRRAQEYLCDSLREFGYEVSLQGKFENVIALPPNCPQHPIPFLTAHYDTVPTTSGADDNSSAIAVCLESARVLALESQTQIGIAIFNREEDGLLGSYDFVAHSSICDQKQVSEVHNFEMVGFFTNEPDSQTKPANLPIPLPSIGNFLGLLSNSLSNKIARRVGKIREELCLSTPVITLQSFLGIEKLFADLLRSDHAPFWEAKIPALMWTDTSNFRNPNYHLPSDLPETLNYDAMADVTSIIVGHLLRERAEI